MQKLKLDENVKEALEQFVCDPRNNVRSKTLTTGPSERHQMEAFAVSIDKFNKFLRRCNRINVNLNAAAKTLAQEANHSVNMSYQLNSYAYFSKGITMMLQSALPNLERQKLEKLFAEGNSKGKEEVRDPNKVDVRKRMLLSSTFATAYRTYKVEGMLLEMKDAQKNYPLMVKKRQFVDRSPVPVLEGVLTQAPQLVPGQNNTHKAWQRQLDQTLKNLQSRYVGGQGMASLFWTKTCKKPKWREFEDSDDEKDYRKKLIKYRSWKYSLFSAKNVQFDRPVSPQKKADNENTPLMTKPKTSLKTHDAIEKTQENDDSNENFTLQIQTIDQRDNNDQLEVSQQNQLLANHLKIHPHLPLWVSKPSSNNLLNEHILNDDPLMTEPPSTHNSRGKQTQFKTSQDQVSSIKQPLPADARNANHSMLGKNQVSEVQKPKLPTVIPFGCDSNTQQTLTDSNSPVTVKRAQAKASFYKQGDSNPFKQQDRKTKLNTRVAIQQIIKQFQDNQTANIHLGKNKERQKSQTSQPCSWQSIQQATKTLAQNILDHPNFAKPPEGPGLMFQMILQMQNVMQDPAILKAVQELILQKKQLQAQQQNRDAAGINSYENSIELLHQIEEIGKAIFSQADEVSSDIAQRQQLHLPGVPQVQRQASGGPCEYQQTMQRTRSSLFDQQLSAALETSNSNSRQVLLAGQTGSRARNSGNGPQTFSFETTTIRNHKPKSVNQTESNSRTQPGEPLRSQLATALLTIIAEWGASTQPITLDELEAIFIKHPSQVREAEEISEPWRSGPLPNKLQQHSGLSSTEKASQQVKFMHSILDQQSLQKQLLDFHGRSDAEYQQQEDLRVQGKTYEYSKTSSVNRSKLNNNRSTKPTKQHRGRTTVRPTDIQSQPPEKLCNAEPACYFVESRKLFKPEQAQQPSRYQQDRTRTGLPSEVDAQDEPAQSKAEQQVFALWNNQLRIDQQRELSHTLSAQITRQERQMAGGVRKLKPVAQRQADSRAKLEYLNLQGQHIKVSGDDESDVRIYSEKPQREHSDGQPGNESSNRRSNEFFVDFLKRAQHEQHQNPSPSYQACGYRVPSKLSGAASASNLKISSTKQHYFQASTPEHQPELIPDYISSDSDVNFGGRLKCLTELNDARGRQYFDADPAHSRWAEKELRAYVDTQFRAGPLKDQSQSIEVSSITRPSPAALENGKMAIVGCPSLPDIRNIDWRQSIEKRGLFQVQKEPYTGVFNRQKPQAASRFNQASASPDSSKPSIPKLNPIQAEQKGINMTHSSRLSNSLSSTINSNQDFGVMNSVAKNPEQFMLIKDQHAPLQRQHIHKNQKFTLNHQLANNQAQARLRTKSQLSQEFTFAYAQQQVLKRSIYDLQNFNAEHINLSINGKIIPSGTLSTISQQFSNDKAFERTTTPIERNMTALQKLCVAKHYEKQVVRKSPLRVQRMD